MIIQNCLSKLLRRYALREDTLTLAALLAKARALELSETQATDMEQNLQSLVPQQPRDTTNLVTRKRPMLQKPRRLPANNRRPNGKC